MMAEGYVREKFWVASQQANLQPRAMAGSSSCKYYILWFR
jgi:hypothetical protein